jgi:hypothetical protein
MVAVEGHAHRKISLIIACGWPQRAPARDAANVSRHDRVRIDPALARARRRQALRSARMRAREGCQ